MICHFLDEDLFFTLEHTATENLTGEYNVYAYIKDRYDEGEGQAGGWGDAIFYGSVFMKAGDKKVSIYLNDILEGQKQVDRSIVAENNELNFVGVNNTPRNYDLFLINLALRNAEGTLVASKTETIQVFLSYRYPNLDANLEVNALPDTNTEHKAELTLLREGYDANTGESLLVPRVCDGMPCTFYAMPTYDFLVTTGGKVKLQNGDRNHEIETSRYEPSYYGLGAMVYEGAEVSLNGLKSVLKEAVYTDTIQYVQDAETYLFHTGLWTAEEIAEKIENLQGGKETLVYYTDNPAEAMFNYTEVVRTFGDGWRDTVEIPVKMPITIAKVDECPARYYVMWYDRLGGIQSQPFSLESQNTFSEGLERRLNKDQYSRSRLLMPTVTPKWKLSSGPIKDECYPIYESLLVSPFVTLYDSKTGKAYNVIPTDGGYTEKTYRNQGKNPINFTVTLELNKQQNILY